MLFFLFAKSNRNRSDVRTTSVEMSIVLSNQINRIWSYIDNVFDSYQVTIADVFQSAPSFEAIIVLGWGDNNRIINNMNKS